MDLRDIREKMVFVGVTAAVFIPLRLLISEFLVEHWLGNLGIATLISVGLAVLIKKEKLGRLGRIFRNQITKTMWSRSARAIVVLMVVFMAYFGTTIILIDRGNTVYFDDKQVLLESMSEGGFDGTVAHLRGPGAQDEAFGIKQVRYMEYVFSISYAVLNDTMGGWLVNLHLIMFMEQIEVLLLLWMFRRFFRPAIPN